MSSDLTALEEAMASGPARRVVIGNHAAGKSRLLDQLAVAVGGAVVRIRGRRLEAGDERSAFDGAEAGPARDRLVSALEAGDLLLVDDAHWLDVASAAIIVGALDRAAATARCVVAARPTPSPPHVAELLAVGDLVYLADRPVVDADEVARRLALLPPDAQRLARAEAHGFRVDDAAVRVALGLDRPLDELRTEIAAEGIDPGVARDVIEPPAIDDPVGLPHLAEALLRSGRLAEATRAALAGDDDRSRAVLGHALATAGLRARAVEVYGTRGVGAASRIALGRFRPDLDADQVAAAVLGAEREALERLVAGAREVELTAAGDLAPDLPHLLGAVAAVAAGRADVASRLLADLAASEIGSVPARRRGEELMAWTALRAGDWSAAVPEPDGDALPLGELLRASVRAGLARRAGDVPALVAAWTSGRAALLRAPVELYTLELVGELALAAARLGPDLVSAEAIADLHRIVSDLGDPPIWALALGWLDLQLAVVGDDPAAVAAAAARLDRLAADNDRPFAHALAEAGAAWAAVVDDRVHVDAVRSACAALSEATLGWEAASLAGAAAIRTGDRQAARALLDLARELRGRLPRIEADGSALGTLTEREREIAAGVVDGLTHREIGEVLFISPKTVEHAVARIRSKLGASTRAEMLARLRSLFEQG